MLDEVGRGTVLAGDGSGNEVGFKSGAVWGIELIGYGHARPQRLSFIRPLAQASPREAESALGHGARGKVVLRVYSHP